MEYFDDELELELELLKRRYKRLTGEDWQPRRASKGKPEGKGTATLTEDEQLTFQAKKMVRLGHAGPREYAGYLGGRRR
jgi:hypothetical protein